MRYTIPYKQNKYPIFCKVLRTFAIKTKNMPMQRSFIFCFVLLVVSCKEKATLELSAQNIVNKSIAACGGELYKTTDISFTFRDKTYISEREDNQRILKRIFESDSSVVVDIKKPDGFQRFVNDSLVVLPDSLSNAYANSVNSVHYFAYLPYGLNDLAVNKELLGEAKIKEVGYYKVKVTFDKEGGGEDFEDTYIYWFNKKTFKPDYLAYKFHVNGGGMRFREAYNERYIQGIRFVDYNNYAPKDKDVSLFGIDSLYIQGKLELLSKIALEDILVTERN